MGLEMAWTTRPVRGHSLRPQEGGSAVGESSGGQGPQGDGAEQATSLSLEELGLSSLFSLLACSLCPTVPVCFLLLVSMGAVNPAVL